MSLPEGVGYGLGIIDFGEGWYGHTGEILGWNTIAVQQPETGAVFVGFVNESCSLPALIGPAIAAFPELVAAF